MNRVEKILNGKYNNEYKFISMDGTKCTIQHICDKCNNYIIEDISIKGNLAKGIYTCPECRRIENEEAFKEKLTEAGFIMTDEIPYVNCDTKVMVQHICDKCNNYKWEVKPRNFSGNCKECSRLARINTEFETKLSERTNGEWKLSSEYINNKLPVEIEHTCGYKKKIVPRNLDTNTLQCNRCECLIENTDDLLWFIETFVPDIELKGEFKGKNAPISIHCNACGKDSTILLCNLKSRQRCPKCLDHFQESIGERELRAYIESLVECHDKYYSKGILNGKDIDILTKNNIGFEYNGEFWHQEVENPVNSWDKPIGYHKDKIKTAKEKDITLYHIWEKEWRTNKNKVKEFIKKALGVDGNE